MSLTVSIQNNTAAKVQAALAAAQSALKTSAPLAAQLFVDEAKAIVPVLTGHLRDGIRQVSVTDEPNVQVIAVTPTKDAENDYGFDPPYARRIEFGFVGADRLGRHYNQAAQPYMRPAFDVQQGPAASALKAAVLAAVKGGA